MTRTTVLPRATGAKKTATRKSAKKTSAAKKTAAVGKGRSKTPIPSKMIYFFGGGKAEGKADMKDLLGGKGAGLAEMTNAGDAGTRRALPLPRKSALSFTRTT